MMQLLITGAQFWQVVNAVAGSAAKDEARPILATIHVQIIGSRLRLVAADGHRYSEIEVSGARIDEGGADDMMTYGANCNAAQMTKIAIACKRLPTIIMQYEPVDIGARWSLISGATRYEVATVAGDFPDIRATFIDKTPRLLFQCSPRYLRDLMAQAMKAGADRVHVFQVADEGGKWEWSPIVIRFDDNERSPETNPYPMIGRSVLMPMTMKSDKWMRNYVDPNWPHPGLGFGKVPEIDNGDPTSITG